MEQQMHQIINDVYADLEAALAAVGESLDAETLADTVGDRMHDTDPAYRALPYQQRRALTLKVCSQYA